MSRNVAVRVPHAVRPEPRLPPVLESAVQAYRAGDTGAFEQFVAALVPRDIPHIDALIQLFDDRTAEKINKQRLEDWLFPFADSVARTPDDTACDARVRDVLATAPGLPAYILSDQSMAALVRAFSWFPSSKELVEFLESRAFTGTRRRASLVAIRDEVARRGARLPVSEPTEVERKQVADAVAGLIAELAMRSIPGPATRNAPAPGLVPRRVAAVHGIARSRQSDIALAAHLGAQLVHASPEQAALLEARLTATRERIAAGGY